MSIASGNHRPRISDILDRAPPFDHHAEACCLGSILIGGCSILAEVAAIIRPADFHDVNHREVASVLWAMLVAGEEPDATLVASRTKLTDLDDAAYYIASLAQSVGVAAHGAKYAAVVSRKAKQRALIRAATDAIARAHEGDDPETIVVDLGEELSEHVRSAGKPIFSRLTCGELDANSYGLEYLIDRTLVAGQPCIIAGGKKCLKTSLILDMGISLATGGFFLGKFPVSRSCRVGIMTGESGLATIQETCRRIAWSAGRKLANVEGLIFSEDLPQFGNIEHENAIRQFITADALEVLVIDPAYMALPGGDAGNLFIQGDLLRGMTKVCAETGCTMILCHHTRKTKVDPFAPPELEDIAWAGFQEFARQWILVGRREPYEPGTGCHRLWLSVGGFAGHTALWALNIDEGTRDDEGGRRWDVDIMNASEARNDADRRRDENKDAERQEQFERDKQTICDTMVKFPNGETKTVIRDASGVRPARFGPAFGSLLTDGDIEPSEVYKGNRNRPYDAYKLVSGDPQ